MAEPSRMWLRFCRAAERQPRASPSSCQQAPETDRKKESRPAPNFTSLPALTAGTVGGMGSHTDSADDPGEPTYAELVVFSCLFPTSLHLYPSPPIILVSSSMIPLTVMLLSPEPGTSAGVPVSLQEGGSV